MKIGIVMDPIEDINIKKDSSFAMLLAAKARNWKISYMELPDLFIDNDTPKAKMQDLDVIDDAKKWFFLSNPRVENLNSLDIILMRKDPPFNLEYIYSTYILEHAERLGSLVINKPSCLRDVNEKFFITNFKECIAPTLVSCSMPILSDFIDRYQQVILKPLSEMGGRSIFRVSKSDYNRKVILEMMTNNSSQFIMAQKFIPEISAGDKRVILLDGKPIPYALARIPAHGETRGNLAQGGYGKGIKLSTRDKWICEQIGPRLREMGLIFVGIDIIGDYLTEINITSPTCICELNNIYDLDIGSQLMTTLARYKQKR